MPASLRKQFSLSSLLYNRPDVFCFPVLSFPVQPVVVNLGSSTTLSQVSHRSSSRPLPTSHKQPSASPMCAPSLPTVAGHVAYPVTQMTRQSKILPSSSRSSCIRRQRRPTKVSLDVDSSRSLLTSGCSSLVQSEADRVGNSEGAPVEPTAISGLPSFVSLCSDGSIGFHVLPCDLLCYIVVCACLVKEGKMLYQLALLAASKSNTEKPSLSHTWIAESTTPVFLDSPTTRVFY
ncbi:hypothetical protein GHT06_018546 [Daphnia sinensis]|uniref:Uncharacterized protein n=1 Tax=Daphnia sinensis TaxID=1820382 RepID=A0AAD5PSC2_9CRUS|nr:hypothetical protein GHT06_018546 [Daphnia sinensis]